MKTIKIGNTIYELEQHDNGKILSEIKIPKGKRLLLPWEAQRLFDLNYFINVWIFVKNPLNNNLVARFDADGGRAYLYCDRDPSGRGSDLGVIFAEDKNE